MQKTVLFRGEPLAYDITGRGLPVMTVHGFTEDRFIWNSLIGGLPEKYRWINADLPGSGDSVFNGDLRNTADFAMGLRAILEEENIEQIALIGHSMGGYISLSFAGLYPGSLSGLGLFHSTAFADSDEKKQARRKSIDFIRKHGPAAYVEQSIPGLYGERFKREHPEIIQQQVDRHRRFNSDALIQYLEMMMGRKETTSVLKTTKIPFLFIMGEEDKAAPLHDVLQQCHLPQLSDIHVLTGTAHMGMQENEKLCNGYIDQFLDCLAISHIPSVPSLPA